jgi:hypothetical protein
MAIAAAQRLRVSLCTGLHPKSVDHGGHRAQKTD